MKKIVLGYLPDDYDPDVHVVIGPWTYLKKQNLLFNGEAVYEPDPYKNMVELKSDADISNEFAEYALDKLIIKLNIENGVAYTKAFWQVIVMSWLSTLIQMTIERYRRVEKLLEKYPTEIFDVELIKASDLQSFKNTKSFFYSGVFSVSCNEWLFSRILEKIPQGHLQIKWKKFNKTNTFNENKSTSLPFSRNILCILNRIFPVLTVYGIVLEAPFWEMLIKAKRYSVKKNEEPTIKIENCNSSFDTIKRIVDWDLLIQKSIPKFFLEIPSNLKKPKPRYLLIGQRNLYQNDSIDKLKIAMHKEAGSKVFCSQHGSRYGTLDAVPYIRSVEYNQDGFITWGWKKQSNYEFNALPLPSPYLKNKAKNKTDKLLFMGQHSSLFSYRLDSIPQPGNHIEIAKQLSGLISHLNIDIRKNLICRFYPHDPSCFDYMHYISKLYNKLEIPEKFKKEWVYFSRLLLIDHPGTALHKRLALNLPIIAYWDDKMWGLCKQAQPYFRALRDVEILLSDGRSAAKKVNEIWHDVEGWWLQPGRQKAIKEWAWQYARTSKRWRREWIKAIKNL